MGKPTQVVNGVNARAHCESHIVRTRVCGHVIAFAMKLLEAEEADDMPPLEKVACNMSHVSMLSLTKLTYYIRRWGKMDRKMILHHWRT